MEWYCEWRDGEQFPIIRTCPPNPPKYNRLATYGVGAHIARFRYGDKPINTVVIHAADRSGIARILRKYRKAIKMVDNDENGTYQPTSYRDLASKQARVDIFTLTKSGESYVKETLFFSDKNLRKRRLQKLKQSLIITDTDRGNRYEL